jgi:acetyltransferase-like isoleucine patch superfamily enzyme
MREVDITEDFAASLAARHIHLPAGKFRIDDTARLEPPCALMGGFQLLEEMTVGAFSYAWSPLVNVSQIGRYCSIGGGVRFGETEHSTDWISTSSFTYDPNFIWGSFTAAHGRFTVAYLPREPKRAPVSIGNDVWIGTAAYIKGGVSLGTGSIVGTHAVVTKDVPPYAIVGGNPARILRYRFDLSTIERLLALRWWEFSYVDFDGLDITDTGAFITGLNKKIATSRISEYRPNTIDLAAAQAAYAAATS